MAVKYSKWPYNIPIFSFQGPSKFTQIWIFGFENIASGNPVAQTFGRRKIFGVAFHRWLA
jgi:hypothetical protein